MAIPPPKGHSTRKVLLAWMESTRARAKLRSRIWTNRSGNRSNALGGTMPPAARVSDMHTCPMVTGVVPHVGGPILPPGCPTVMIGFLPAARVTDMATCVGPPDVIVKGSSSVMIGMMPAARIGDQTAHGGVIVLGCFTVMIGG